MRNTLGGSLVLILGVSLFLWKFKSSSVEEIVSVPKEGGRAPAALSQQQFDFERKVKASLDQKVLAERDYQGLFNVQTLSNQRYRFSFSLTDEKGQGVPSNLFLEATLNPDLEILSVSEPTPQSAEEEDVLTFLKDLVSIFAYRSHQDTAGNYAYEIKNLGTHQLMKRKTRYLDEKINAITLVESIHRINPGIEYSGLEITSLKLSLGKSAQELVTKTSYRMVLSKENKPISFVSSTKGVRARDLHFGSLKVSPVFSVHEKTSWESVAARLGTLSQVGAQERGEIFHKTVMALNDHPEKLADFLGWFNGAVLNASFFNASLFSFGIGTLATVGTPDAQHALVQLYQRLVSDPSQVAQCHSILNALTTTEVSLTEEVHSLLATELNQIHGTDLAMNAAFALGTAIQKETALNLDSQADVVALAQAAAQAKSQKDRLDFLDAMGNSGNAAFLPQISEQLRSQDPLWREKATYALRFMNDSSAAPLLTNALNDSSLGVQIAAVRAIALQKNLAPYQASLNACAASAVETLSALCSKVLSN